MKCPRCGVQEGNAKYGYAGKVKKQRFKCNDCGYLYTQEFPKEKWPSHRDRVLELLEVGRSYSQIASDTGVNRSTATNWLKEKVMEDEGLKRFFVLTLQLYLENFTPEKIAASIGVNYIIVKYWINHYQNMKVKNLPRLKDCEIIIPVKTKLPRYDIWKRYSVEFYLRSTTISIVTRPKDFESLQPTHQIRPFKHISGFALTRIVQLYLLGVDYNMLAKKLNFNPYKDRIPEMEIGSIKLKNKEPSEEDIRISQIEEKSPSISRFEMDGGVIIASRVNGSI